MTSPDMTEYRRARTGPAARRWAEALAAWAIPDDILAGAPASPWEFSPSLFARVAEKALGGERCGPSEARALEALPPGGSVLDVGVGGGAASLPLVPPAALLVGVDQSGPLLAAFGAAAEKVGVAHREVEGSWPAVAAAVEPADVVVCHHVLYNIADLVPFVVALTMHARRRVVVEMSAEHPWAGSNPLWKAIHGIDRPTTPTAADALGVLTELGLDVGHEEILRQPRGPLLDRHEEVAHARRRLCVGPERDADIAALLPPDSQTAPRRIAVFWWDGVA